MVAAQKVQTAARLSAEQEFANTRETLHVAESMPDSQSTETGPQRALAESVRTVVVEAEDVALGNRPASDQGRPGGRDAAEPHQHAADQLDSGAQTVFCWSDR